MQLVDLIRITLEENLISPTSEKHQAEPVVLEFEIRKENPLQAESFCLGRIVLWGKSLTNLWPVNHQKQLYTMDDEHKYMSESLSITAIEKGSH